MTTFEYFGNLTARPKVFQAYRATLLPKLDKLFLELARMCRFQHELSEPVNGLRGNSISPWGILHHYSLVNAQRKLANLLKRELIELLLVYVLQVCAVVRSDVP